MPDPDTEEASSASTASTSVSCLMVTRAKRFELAQLAVQSFLRQTYTPRTLVVVHELEETPVPDDREKFAERIIAYVTAQIPALPAKVGLRVMLVYSTTRSPISLAKLRNIALESAPDNFVIQWDDDGQYHPRRIELQMEQLLRVQPQTEQREVCCCLTDQLYFMQPTGKLYWIDWRRRGAQYMIPGTILTECAGSRGHRPRGRELVLI